jgi:hypothetical protein
LSDGVAAGRGKEFDTLMQLRAITKHWIVRQWPEHPVTGRIPAGPAIPPWANDRDTGGAYRQVANWASPPRMRTASGLSFARPLRAPT